MKGKSVQLLEDAYFYGLMMGSCFLNKILKAQSMGGKTDVKKQNTIKRKFEITANNK